MAAHHYSQERGCCGMSLGDLHNLCTHRDLALPGRDCSMKHCWLCHLGTLSTPRHSVVTVRALDAIGARKAWQNRLRCSQPLE